ncbi:MAG: EamA family transporter [Burkholderiales bacterium]|nr:EamA family transporter [Burkholderiales bacterium]
MDKKYLNNYIFLLLISIIWGAQFALNKISLITLTPMMVATGRTIIGGITLSIYLWLVNKRTQVKPNIAAYAKSTIILYILIALCEAVCPLFLIAWGLKHVSGGIAAVLMGSVPIFTVVIEAIVKRNPINKRFILAIGIGFIGMLILAFPEISHGSSSILGVIAILLGSFSFASSLILINLLPPKISAVRHMRNILGYASLLLIIISMATHEWVPYCSLQSVLALLILGSICTGLVYVMFIVLIHATSPTFASLINYLIPIVGVIIGNLFMHEKITWNEIVSLLCIVIALYQIRLHANHKNFAK